MKGKKLLILIPILFVFLTLSCNHEEKKNKDNILENVNNTHKNNPLKIEFSEPKKDNFIVGDKITITVKCDSISSADTLNLYSGEDKLSELSANNLVYELDTKNSRAGKNTIKVELFRHGKKFKKESTVILLSDIVPKEYGYKVKKVYKHDVNAYTQGLFYKDGFLYEATGLKGESTVRKVDYTNGDVVQSFSVSKEIFGEGITYFDDKIVQISWQAQKGFVYNFEDLKLITEFSYPGEGWGIIYDGENLIMSNGTSEMLIIDPQTFSVTGRFDVYDNKGPVKSLNELEYIDGKIYANIYQYSKIVIIDPKTGKVTANIDLDGLLPMNDYDLKTDVLNGIAYDNEQKRLFVTGKLWPKLFEIELVEK